MKVYAVSCRSPKTRKDLEEILENLNGVEKDSLLCFPEYFLSKHPQRYVAMQKTDEVFTDFLDFARKKEVYLASGIVEKEKNRKYVAGILVNPKGRIIGKQRKIHPTPLERENRIYAGKWAGKIIETGFGTVAFSMCVDQWHLNKKLDTEIIVHPRGFGLNEPEGFTFYENWLLIDRATAMLSKTYLVGTTGGFGESPLSDIISFEGEVLAISNKKGVVSAEIDLNLLRKYRKKEFVSKIVPEF